MQAYLVLRIRLQPQQTSKFAAPRVQHRGPDEIARVRVHAVQDAPFEAVEHASRIPRRDVEAGEDLLSLPRRAADLLPALEEVVGGEDGAVHVLVECDGEFERQRLERAGHV